MDVPVYLITGFLESGKTTFLQGVLGDPDFSQGERTLLIVCEEGIEEYDPIIIGSANANTNMVVVEDKEELTEFLFGDESCCAGIQLELIAHDREEAKCK